MPKSTKNPIILFDGECKFCHASVQFVIKRDPQKRFLFCPLQSPKGQQLALNHGLKDIGLTSMILLAGNNCYQKSTAALRIARKLKAPWPVLYVFIVVPRFLRDAVYDFIGNHRYQWFGKFEQCMIPDDQTRQRFLE